MIAGVTLWGNGAVDRVIVHEIASSPPHPPASITRESASAAEIEKVTAGSTKRLLKTPAFKWSFGCAPTSAAMLAGFYDRGPFPNVYSGPTNGGLMPMDNSVWPTWTDSAGDTRYQCPLSATHKDLDGRTTRGHVDDYWIEYDNDDDDPFIQNGWTEHTYGECTADYMKTNQTTNYGNSDGATAFYFYSDGTPLTAQDMENGGVEDDDGAYGLKLFFESRGYTVTELYNQRIDADQQGGFTFEQYKKEIDEGHPVIIHVHGHAMEGVGYDASTNTVYLYDTWDYDLHTMTWGGDYSGMTHYGVSVIHLQNSKRDRDFNGDGMADILFRDSNSGKNLILYTNSTYAYTTKMSSAWDAVGIGDFNSDGIADILFRNATDGRNLIFFQSSSGARSSYAYTTAISNAWSVTGVGDFDGDGISDILFRNPNTGKNLIFFQNSDGSRKGFSYTSKLSSAWIVGGVADYNGDGIADIFFRNSTNGKNLIFFQKADGKRDRFEYITRLSSAWSAIR
jgi:hypothetical protein